jgi:hypothetical protein
MENTESMTERLDWAQIHAQLDVEGFAVLPGLLPADGVHELTEVGNEAGPPVWLAEEHLGEGELRYLPRKLPPFLQELRETFYRRLAPAANRWAGVVGGMLLFPAELSVFLEKNRVAGQTHALSHTTVIPTHGYQVLHQRAAGAHVFPFQLAALLSEPQQEFTGGELVLVERRPRMQSRPMVLPLKCGDVAVIATAQRPHKGSKGYYRVSVKHGISRVRSGTRLGMELLFHESAEFRASWPRSAAGR